MYEVLFPPRSEIYSAPPLNLGCHWNLLSPIECDRSDILGLPSSGFQQWYLVFFDPLGTQLSWKAAQARPLNDEKPWEKREANLLPDSQPPSSNADI